MEAPFIGAGWTFNRPGSILPSRAREACNEPGVRILCFFPPPKAVRVPVPLPGARNRGLADAFEPTNPHRTCQVQIVFLLLLLRSLLLRALLLSTLLLGHGSITSLALIRLDAADPPDSAWTISPATFHAASNGRPWCSRVRHDALRGGSSSMRATSTIRGRRRALSRCGYVDCDRENSLPARARAVENVVGSRGNCQFSWGLGGRPSVSRCEKRDYEKLSTSL